MFFKFGCKYSNIYLIIRHEKNQKFIRRFMDEIHQESIRHQLKVMNPKIDTEFSNED